MIELDHPTSPREMEARLGAILGDDSYQTFVAGDSDTIAGVAQHPIPGAHSIWELVLHLAAGYRLVLRRLDGDGRQLSPEEDWPTPPAPTPDAWARDVAALFTLNRQLRDASRPSRRRGCMSR